MTIPPEIELTEPAEANSVRPKQLASPALLARNATLNLVTEVWIFLVLIVAMPKLVTFLGETSFGLFSLAWVVIGYLTFLDIGVSRAVTKFVSEHLAEQNLASTRQVVRTALVANLALGLAGGLAIVLVSPYLVHSVFKVSADLENQARLVFYAAGFAVPVLLVQGVLRAVLSSFQRFGWINAVNGLATTAQWGLACWLAWRGHGVAVVVLATVGARMVAAAAYGAVLFRVLPGLHLFRIRGLIGLPKLLRFGSWVTVSQLVSPALVYLDRLLIASFVSLGAVTLYTVPYEVMMRLRIIPSSLVTTLYPAFSERRASQDEANLQRLYDGSVRYLLLLLVPGIVFLFVLGNDLLGLWMGTAFASQTSVVLQILAAGVLVNCLANVPYYAIQALGRPDLTGKFHLLELPLYIGLCALTIPRWGIAGAALANTMRVSLDAGLLFWAARRYCHCSLGEGWARTAARILMLGVLLGLALLGVRSAIASVWMRLALGAFAVGLYFLAAWIFVLDGRDKPRISEALKMLIGQPAS